MQHIGKSIKKLLKKNGLEKGIAQQNAIDIWPEVVGSQVSEKTKATEIEHGVMIVKTETPAWRQELQFQKKDIISAMNKKLTKTIIKDIRFI
tara:strand:- start:793 stop:1068 length:276 start_codon:yes stop_codon:yes gene_type:complete